MFGSDSLKRLLGCLAGGFVLALMYGKQEGTQQDYGYAFRQAVFGPRIALFLGIGVLIFLAITFWPIVAPYLTRPGVWPLIAGLLTVVASQVLLKWYDQVGDGKFSTLATAVGDSTGVAPLAAAFFAWLAWTQLIVITVLAGIAAARRIAIAGWAVAVLSLVAAAIAYTSHRSAVDLAGGIDHSLGAWVCVVGYLSMAVAGASIALSTHETARTRETAEQILAWRPGLPLVALGLVAGVLAMASATWISPSGKNATMSDAHNLFEGTGLASIAVQYLIWLGWTLLAVGVIASGAGTYLRNAALCWTGAVVGIVGVVLTVVTLYDISSVAADAKLDGATGAWQNLGSGGWLAAIAFTVIAAGGVLGVMTPAAGTGVTLTKQATPRVSRSKKMFGGSSTMATLAMVGIAMALFYPPTATSFWQQVLVSEIGIYVLLAIGLNVVVGWAGLLDLGFIAFYAIGSYTTAYLVGSLPIKPPFTLSPLLAIPVAVIICLIAGVALGAPTLRLRGDYLAIVTLGFGEIIRIVAINADGVTNSTRGPDPQVPHPVINLGFVKITWGLNQLQYWYLLLILIIIVVVLFYRLEGSRIGRAWAAIREDEVAAQATGINTVRVKLLAFAIGASTSGLAGVFFASQVGYFNPDNFQLNFSILVVAYVVFGGMGSLPGAMAGAAVLTWLPEFLKDQVPADDRQMWIGAVLLAMMIFRPAGLFPARRRKAELHGLDQADSAEVHAVPVGEGMGGTR